MRNTMLQTDIWYPHANRRRSLDNIKVEVELGFDRDLGLQEAQRCLNCDVQTVFTESLCIECDACVDICPMDCISFTDNQPEPELRHDPDCASDQ